MHQRYLTLDHGIVVITGASSGIGFHTAEFLARNHSYVVYATVRNEEDKARLEELGVKNLHPILADVTQHDSCVHLVETIKEHSQRDQLPLVAVVNNAAINRMLPAEFHPLEDVKLMFETNVLGAIDLVQLTLPMLRQSKGRVIFLSSFVATQPVPLASVYSATKTALEGFADSLRREIAPFDISVSIIKPGFVLSEMNRKNEYLNDEIVPTEMKTSMQQTYNRLFNEDYRSRFEKMVDKSEQPIVVVKKIVHAITNPYPKTRYYVANVNGLPVRLLAALAWLQGDRMQDLYLAVK